MQSTTGQNSAGLSLRCSHATLTSPSVAATSPDLNITKVYGYSLNGRSSEDRLVIGRKMNPHWQILDEKTKEEALNAAIAKMQYLSWKLIESLNEPDCNSSGACITAFVPGYLIQLGDSVAVNLDKKEYLDIRPVQSDTPSDNLGRTRLSSGINMSRSLGDPLASRDPRFDISPHIVRIPEQCHYLLATDGITDDTQFRRSREQEKKPISLREIRAIIQNHSKDTTANIAEIVAKDIHPRRTNDDTSIMIFNSSSDNILGVIDGHGKKTAKLSLISIPADCDLCDFSLVFSKVSEKVIPVLIKKGKHAVYIYGTKKNGKRGYVQLDTNKLGDLQFPPTGQLTAGVPISSLPQAVRDAVVNSDLILGSGHYTANAVKDNLSDIINETVELHYRFCIAEECIKDLLKTLPNSNDPSSLYYQIDKLLSQLSKMNPYLFGQWDIYKHKDEKTYEHFSERFENEALKAQIKKTSDLVTTLESELKGMATKEANVSISQSAFSSSSSISSAMFSSTHTTEHSTKIDPLLKAKQALLDFVRFQSNTLREFQNRVETYKASKAYMAIQTENVSYPRVTPFTFNKTPQMSSSTTTFASVASASSTMLFSASSGTQEEKETKEPSHKKSSSEESKDNKEEKNDEQGRQKRMRVS